MLHDEIYLSKRQPLNELISFHAEDIQFSIPINCVLDLGILKRMKIRPTNWLLRKPIELRLLKSFMVPNVAFLFYNFSSIVLFPFPCKFCMHSDHINSVDPS